MRLTPPGTRKGERQAIAKPVSIVMGSSKLEDNMPLRREDKEKGEERKNPVYFFDHLCNRKLHAVAAILEE